MTAPADVILVESLSYSDQQRPTSCARLILADGSTRNVNQTPRHFAAEHAFRYLQLDDIATNPTVSFSVSPRASDDPQHVNSRLSWGRPPCIGQKLLRSPPAAVVAAVLIGCR